MTMNNLSITIDNENLAIDAGENDIATVVLNNLSIEFIRGAHFFNVMIERRSSMELNSNLSLDDDFIADNSLDLFMYNPFNDDLEVVEYNKAFKNFLSIYDSKRYTMTIRDNDGFNHLVHFGDLEFLNGIQSIIETMIFGDNNIRIKSVHDNGQLCYRYIKHEIDLPNLNPVRDVFKNINIVIKDLVEIILEYYPDMCKHFDYQREGKDSSSDPNSETPKLAKYVYCDTLCEIGEEFCEVCRVTREGQPYSKMYKSLVRLEIAN